MQYRKLILFILNMKTKTCDAGNTDAAAAGAVVQTKQTKENKRTKQTKENKRIINKGKVW